jgi:uncharacterized protein YbjT (DUF2867 family)
MPADRAKPPIPRLKVLLLGATGMVGQGVLRECLLDPGVESVLAIGRSATGRRDPKLREIVVGDLFDLSGIEADLSGLDACFFCLGVSAVGMSEESYTRITFDLTLNVATALTRLDPDMTFVYVSGTGTDSTERGRAMWARVKGRTENALLALTLRAYMFRPGVIVPLHGIRSKTGWYRALYVLMTPLSPVLRRIFPRSVTTTEHVGRAMIAVARHGYPKRVIETRDIDELGNGPR